MYRVYVHTMVQSEFSVSVRFWTPSEVVGTGIDLRRMVDPLCIDKFDSCVVVGQEKLIGQDLMLDYQFDPFLTSKVFSSNLHTPVTYCPVLSGCARFPSFPW